MGSGTTKGVTVRFGRIPSRPEPSQPVPEPPANAGSGTERDTGWRVDLAASLVSMGLGAWLFRQTFSFSVTASERVGGGIDAAGYPRLLAGLTVLLGLALAGRALWKWRTAGRAAAPGPAGDAAAQGGGKLRAALAFAVLLLYTLLLEPLGFLLATPLAVGVLLRIIGGRGPLHATVAAIAFTAAIFVFFRYGVNIVLPEGLLRGISP